MHLLGQVERLALTDRQITAALRAAGAEDDGDLPSPQSERDSFEELLQSPPPPLTPAVRLLHELGVA